jgi:hypothetical protein
MSSGSRGTNRREFRAHLPPHSRLPGRGRPWGVRRCPWRRMLRKIPNSSKNTRMGGRSARSRHDVIRHLAVLHASILPNYFFIKAESDPLRNATDDLSSSPEADAELCQLPGARRNRPPTRHRSSDHRDFRDVNRPGKCRVGFASIFLIVPENVAGRLVTRPGAELAML